MVCRGGLWVDTCVPAPVGPEICDGRDERVPRKKPANRPGQAQSHELGGPPSAGRCLPGASCEGPSDCDGETDEGTEGWYFHVVQPPAAPFPVTAVAEPGLGPVACYGYDPATGSAATFGSLEREDALVLYVYRDPAGQHSLNIVFDEAMAANGNGYSTATGGSAELALSPGPWAVLVRDDPGDGFRSRGGWLFDWTWPPGRTDGAVIGGLVPPFCLELSPLELEKIDELLFHDVATGTHVPLGDLVDPITLCAEHCCTPTGPELCDGRDERAPREKPANHAGRAQSHRLAQLRRVITHEQVDDFCSPAGCCIDGR